MKSFLLENIGSVTTLLVGLFAFGVYLWQKYDNKKDAANIILLEIKNAERALRKVKNSLSKEILEADIVVMPEDSWSKHRYLFVRNFDRDEWDLITDFYAKCKLIDESIRYNNSAFLNDVEQIRANKQRVLADYTKEHVKLENTDDEIRDFMEITDKFDTVYMKRQDTFMYLPVKPVNDAKLYLSGISISLSQSSVGTKLKKIARIKP